ncbi:MAG: hemK [Bacteroidetes bacterium]|nr:hemK [Bacteroidota bacterium]
MAHPGTDSAQQWTVLSLLQWGSDYLKEKGFDEPRLTVDLLLAHVLSLPRLNLYLQFDRPLTADELSRFKALFKRRLSREPLQYIIGETDFMGLRVRVTPDVLVPRPETELLAERAIEELKRRAPGSQVVLEIGTGSGNLAMAIARFVPTARIVSIDVSAPALAVARENLRTHGIETVDLEVVDVFSDWPEDRRFDLIVSNPPYISLTEFAELQPEVRDFEPRLATTDESDGLRVIRRIVDLAGTALLPGGSLLLEVAYDQSRDVTRLLEQRGLKDVRWYDDHAGIPRVVSALREGLQ